MIDVDNKMSVVSFVDIVPTLPGFFSCRVVIEGVLLCTYVSTETRAISSQKSVYLQFELPKMAPTRWGICSAGKISHDFVLCLKHLARADRTHEAVAVAARSDEDAKKFAEKHGISEHYGDYAKLAENAEIGKHSRYSFLVYEVSIESEPHRPSAQTIDSDVISDVIYVSTLHTQHYKVVKMFLEAGKAVLCEKPMTMCLKHTKALVELARRQKVFLMEVHMYEN